MGGPTLEEWGASHQAAPDSCPGAARPGCAGAGRTSASHVQSYCEASGRCMRAWAVLRPLLQDLWMLYVLVPATPCLMPHVTRSGAAAGASLQGRPPWWGTLTLRCAGSAASGSCARSPSACWPARERRWPRWAPAPLKCAWPCCCTHATHPTPASPTPAMGALHGTAVEHSRRPSQL